MKLISTLAFTTAMLAAAVSPAAAQDLTGAGATFPYPLYSKWFDAYATKTGVRINYQSIGSGGGIRQLSEQTVDFGASDAPMSDAELARAKGGPVLHVPTVLGAVVVTYNVPELKKPLRLDGATLGDIFLGKITKWNDARIAALNAGARLPAADILVVHRSDGSGTSYVFTDYLASVSAAWAAKPGKGKEVQWPVGLGAKGNEGVAGQIKQLPGSIGYVELAYAKQNALAFADIRNAKGQFVAPTIAAVTAAAAGAAASLPATTDYRVSIVNANGANAYPISSFTWLLVYRTQTDAAKSKKLLDFVRWALTDGEKSAAALDYAPLPASMSKQLLKHIGTVTAAAK
jgi:phosphate transport system substrate-binding protein